MKALATKAKRSRHTTRQNTADEPFAFESEGEKLMAACDKAAKVLSQAEITRLSNKVWRWELPGDAVVISYAPGDSKRALAAKTLLQELGYEGRVSLEPGA